MGFGERGVRFSSDVLRLIPPGLRYYKMKGETKMWHGNLFVALRICYIIRESGFSAEFMHQCASDVLLLTLADFKVIYCCDLNMET